MSTTSLRNFTLICRQLTIHLITTSKQCIRLCIKCSLSIPVYLSQGLNLWFFADHRSMAASRIHTSILGICCTQHIPNSIPRCEQNKKLTSLWGESPLIFYYIIMRCTLPPSCAGRRQFSVIRLWQYRSEQYTHDRLWEDSRSPPWDSGGPSNTLGRGEPRGWVSLGTW